MRMRRGTEHTTEIDRPFTTAAIDGLGQSKNAGFEAGQVPDGPRVARSEMLTEVGHRDPKAPDGLIGRPNGAIAPIAPGVEHQKSFPARGLPAVGNDGHGMGPGVPVVIRREARGVPVRDIAFPAAGD